MSTTVETAFEVRPFHVDVPQEELGDLRRRIGATRFADQETVGDQSNGGWDWPKARRHTTRSATPTEVR